MLRQERINNLNVGLRLALEGWQSGMWTNMPAIIESFDPVANTVRAVPAVKGFVMREESWPAASKFSPKEDHFPWVTMPVLVDVPVIWLSGGGFSATFPIKKGDEAMIFFASRCIDAWWQSGKVDIQAELRMHDLSDGFALVGPRSTPHVLTGVSTTSAQLRSDDGELYIELAAGHIANIVAPGGLNITANIVITGTVTANSHRIDETHKHKDVTAGGANTGVVT